MKTSLKYQTPTRRPAAHLIASLAALLLAATSPGVARANDHHDSGGGIAPGHSHAFGRSLTEWTETYWRWNYATGSDPAQSKVGNVQLLPLPAADLVSGTGTPADPALYRGTIEVNLTPGTPFVLPEFAWIGERYNNGTPDDVPIDNAVALRGSHPLLTIDGKVVLSDRNKAQYYVPATRFDPPVLYPAPSSYGSVAALSFQGVTVVGLPLSKGVHIIHLYEPITIPAGAYIGLPAGLGLIYDNTWIVTVSEPAEVLSPDKRYAGLDYSQWSAKWWQWFLEYPVQDSAGNPLPHPGIDDPRFDASNRQSGPVWFIGSPFGTVVRNATVPANKALFVALVNGEASSLEPPPFHGDTEAQQRAAAAASADQIVNVSCTIDGVPVDNIAAYRVQSPQFSFNAPTPWIFGPTGGAGTSVGDGYYVLIKPLGEGHHTLHYAGALLPDPASAFLDVTYHLNVVGHGGDRH